MAMLDHMVTGRHSTLDSSLLQSLLLSSMDGDGPTQADQFESPVHVQISVRPVSYDAGQHAPPSRSIVSE
jgi:hypothetical protein